VLLGFRISPTIVEVHKWKYPRNLRVQTSDAVEGDFTKEYEYARQYGMIVVGDVHSHINEDPIMSPTDFVNHRKNNFCVSGIISVNKKIIDVAFWELHSPLPATLQYIKRG